MVSWYPVTGIQYWERTVIRVPAGIVSIQFGWDAIGQHAWPAKFGR